MRYLLSNARVAWWNLDLGSSDWTTRSAFVPFFGEFVKYMASTAAPAVSRSYEPGEVLCFDAGALDTSDIQLLNEQDKAVGIAVENISKVGRLVSKNVSVPGCYRWQAQGGVLDRAVVNFPETESDLRCMSKQEVEEVGGSVVAGIERERLGELLEGRPLWAWFIGAGALLFLLEGLLLRIFRTKAEPMNTGELKEFPRV